MKKNKSTNPVREAFKSLLQSVERLSQEDVDYLIPHQANQRIIEAMQQRLEYPDEKVISNNRINAY